MDSISSSNAAPKKAVKTEKKKDKKEIEKSKDKAAQERGGLPNDTFTSNEVAEAEQLVVQPTEVKPVEKQEAPSPELSPEDLRLSEAKVIKAFKDLLDKEDAILKEHGYPENIDSETLTRVTKETGKRMAEIFTKELNSIQKKIKN